MQKLFKQIIILCIGALVFSSCKEDEIDSIFFRTDGALSITLTDDDGKAVADARAELYNFSTGNRISVKRTDENGRVDFGRYESGEYLVNMELSHNGEWFDFDEEIHILSGVDTKHNMSLADQRGDFFIKIFNSNDGELINFDLGDLKIGLVPYNDEFSQTINDAEILSLITSSYKAESSLEVKDVPAARYLAVLYDEEIIDSNLITISPFDDDFLIFYVNPMSILLASKSVWTVTNIVSDEPANVLVPISTFSFEDGNMTVTYNNGDVAEARCSFYFGQNFDWYSLSTSNYSIYLNENKYTINTNGSITFNFSYWEIYNDEAGQYYSDNDISITIN